MDGLTNDRTFVVDNKDFNSLCVDVARIDRDVTLFRAEFEEYKRTTTQYRQSNEVRNETERENLLKEIRDLKDEIAELRKTVANRLPLWGTFLFSIMTATIGGLSTLVFAYLNHILG